MIALRENIVFDAGGRIKTFLEGSSLLPSEQKEIDFYCRAAGKKVPGQLFDLITEKANFIKVFRGLLDRFDLKEGMTVLELGAGEGWASCMLKKRYPACHVVAADLSREELAVAFAYEQLQGVTLDDLWACSARNLPFADNQFDQVFTFAAFHHFSEGGDFARPLQETIRVLKPGGCATFIYENCSPRWARGLLRRRALRQRGWVVDEDVLTRANLKKSCRLLPCELSMEYWATYTFREGLAVANYMYLLGKIPFLARWLPCTVNVTLRKHR